MIKEIIGKLREQGYIVNHFVLCASKETLLKRLRSRCESKNSWGAQQIDRCIASLSDELFAFHLDTENLTIEGVADRFKHIAYLCRKSYIKTYRQI